MQVIRIIQCTYTRQYKLCKLYELYSVHTHGNTNGNLYSVHTHGNTNYANYTVYIHTAIQIMQIILIIQCTCTHRNTNYASHTNYIEYQVILHYYHASYTNYYTEMHTAIQIMQVIWCTYIQQYKLCKLYKLYSILVGQQHTNSCLIEICYYTV